MTAGAFVLVLFLSLVTFVVLYLLIRGEVRSTTVTDRADAERDAREFGGRER